MSGTESNTVSGHDTHTNIPLVFLKESSLFGDRKPAKDEWLTHTELYTALSEKVNASHITGLQRVRGLWRIYVDNLEDKVKLMTDGVPLRGKNIPVLNTNPQRPDGENTIKIRIKNIPLSADDGTITRVLTLRGIDVIAVTREKLRIKGRLTNCETGDRFVIVKSSTLKEPLPFSMYFGLFNARVIHTGQKTGPQREITCSKCLQTGHRFNQCTHDWVCRICQQTGHKQSDCPGTTNTCNSDTGKEDSPSENECDSHDETDHNTGHKDRHQTKQKPNTETQRRSRSPRSASLNSKTSRRMRSADSRQPSMEKFVNMSKSSVNLKDTPNKNKQGVAPLRSPPTPVDELQLKTLKQSKCRKK